MPIHPTSEIFPTAKITPSTTLDIGPYCYIGDFSFIHLYLLKMGCGSQINAHASLTGGGTVILGENVVLSYGVIVISASDQPDAPRMNDASPLSKRNVVRGTITIGDNCFIGANSVLTVSRKNPSIVIGSGTVIGSLSFIDRSTPQDVIIVPEKHFRSRDRIISR